MKLSQLPPAEQSAAIEKMVRDLFAGLDAEDRIIAERWLDEHLAGFSMPTLPSCATSAGVFHEARPAVVGEFEALWAATDEPDKARCLH